MAEWKRPFDEEIEELREQHLRIQQIPAGEPVIALPEEIVNDVGFAAKSWVSDEDQAAEAALTDMCKRYGAIGFEENRAVKFAPLLPRKPAPDIPTSSLEEFGMSLRDLGPVARLISQTDQINEQLLGTTGYLVTCPQFLIERDDVRQRFEQAGFGSETCSSHSSTTDSACRSRPACCTRSPAGCSRRCWQPRR